ncbi:MAG: acyl-CoA thioesterase [Fimbriiglobus sp.]
MSEPYNAIQVIMMPRDTNQHGTIFGGVILSYIDLAGAVAAKREVQLRGGNLQAKFVTVAMNKVEFKQPVLVGDVVKFLASLIRIGRTSISFHVNVLAERGVETIPVTEAEITYVGVDMSCPERKPIPLGISM